MREEDWKTASRRRVIREVRNQLHCRISHEAKICKMSAEKNEKMIKSYLNRTKFKPTSQDSDHNPNHVANIFVNLTKKKYLFARLA